MSSRDRGGSKQDGCTTDVSIANTGHINTVDFIAETITQIENTCNLISD